MRFRVIANKQIVIIGISAAIEPNVGAIKAGTANGRVVVTKMAATHVVIGRIDKAILSAIECLALIRIEEGPAGARQQPPRAKTRLFFCAKTGIGFSSLVI